MDISIWLANIELERYSQAFLANNISLDVLPFLTVQDLIDLGVTSIGDRRKLLNSIATLRQATQPQAVATGPDMDAARPRDASQAERRQLTVVFVDLVGSTEMATRLDPEDIHALLRSYQDTVAGHVARWGGYVAKFMGDGVLAYFGWPRAHEDAAERAVRAGLSITAAMHVLTGPGDEPLQARVGIATGLVVVGDLVGEEEVRERAVAGATPNLAARLQALATPGAVVVAPTTRRLLGSLFSYEDLGPQHLKGFPEPVSAWEIRGEGSGSGRFAAQHEAGMLPMVARDSELNVLRELWHRAKGGAGSTVLLSGEPGIGKSRLVQELKNEILDDTDTTVELRCSPHYENTAFFPLVEHIEKLAAFDRSDTATERLSKLSSALSSYDFERHDVLPLLASLLALPHPAGYPQLTFTPQKQKQETEGVLVELLMKRAMSGGFLCVLEDIHWADPSTQQLLTVLAARTASAPMLLVVTFRQEYTPPDALTSGHLHMPLARLEAADISELARTVAGGKWLPPEVAHQIVTKTDGVPLFVEELTKMLLEGDILREINARYELVGPLPALAIPGTLHDSLMARLDRMELPRNTAQLAAVIGRDFSYDLIRAVSPLDEAILDDSLAQLVEADLVLQQGSPPRAQYSFKHALVRDTAYESLLRAKRQELHRGIALVLEHEFPEIADKQPELLARHYTGAGLLPEAIDCWQRAGEQELRRSANLEAISHFRASLDLLTKLPNAPDREERELTLQICLSAPLMATRGWADNEVERVAARAYELSRSAGTSASVFPALWALWNYYIVGAKLGRALELGKECLQLAHTANDPILTLHADYVIGDSYLWRGEFGAASRHLDREIPLTDSVGRYGHALTYGLDPGVACFSHAAWALWLLGYPERAIERSQLALTMAHELSHPASTAWALWSSAVLHRQRAEPTIVEERISALLGLAEQHGFPHWLMLGTIMRNCVFPRQDHYESSINEMRGAIDTWRAMGALLDVPHCLCLLADACASAGRFDEAFEAVVQARDQVERSGERMWEAEILRLRGELALKLDPLHGSEADLQESLAIARRQGAKALELRAACSLAARWRDQGKPQKARDLLSPIYHSFTEGHNTRDLQQAHTLIQSLSRM